MIPNTKTSNSGNRSRWLIAELLVIVLGVLIALAIDEWREGVNDAKTRNEYLQQLVADLQSTEDLMAEVAEDNAKSLTAAKDLVAAFESDQVPSLDTIRQLLKDMSFYNNPVPVLGTVEALVSTGDLRLIENAKTRSEITRYLSTSRDYFLIPLYQYEQEHRNLVHQLMVLAGSSGISINNPGRHGQSAIEANVAEFLDNPEAYVITLMFAKQKFGMQFYRDGVATDSSKLRKSLQSQVVGD